MTSTDTASTGSKLTQQRISPTPTGGPSGPIFALLTDSAPNRQDEHLQQHIEQLVGDLPGTWGVVVKKLNTGQYASYQADVPQVSASLYKLWVLNELYREVESGDIRLDEVEQVTSEDAQYDASINNLQLKVGEVLTLHRAADLMIERSDNTAAHILVRRLGADNVKRFMEQNGLYHSVFNWSDAGDNLTTPSDVLRELEMLATGRMVDADASKQMLEILLDQRINNLLAPGIPSQTPFAHKHGLLGGLLHDAGIVYGPTGPFIIVAMSSNLPEHRLAYDKMPQLAREIYDYFNP